MGQRGPAPKPVELRVGHRANPDYASSNICNTPAPKKGSPPMPPDMSEAAQAHWHKTLAILEDMRVVTVADGDVLHHYCETFVKWDEARKDVDLHGISEQAGKDGRSFPRPEYRVFKDMSAELFRLFAVLGLSPSARARIEVTPKDPEPADDEAGKKQRKIKDEYGMTPE